MRRRSSEARVLRRTSGAVQAAAGIADLIWRALLSGAAGLCLGAGAAAAFGRTGTATSLVHVAAVLAVLGIVLGIAGLAAAEPVDLRDAPADPLVNRPLDHRGLESPS